MPPSKRPADRPVAETIPSEISHAYKNSASDEHASDEPADEPAEEAVDEEAVDDEDSNNSDDGDDHDDDGDDGTNADGVNDNGEPVASQNSKLAYTMSRILGSSGQTQAAAQEDSAHVAKKAKKEKPILSKQKSLQTAIDDAKLEEKAKKLLSRERKLRLHDVARVQPEDVVAANDHEKKLKKIATRGVVKLFNAIRAAQKTVESVKADSVLKNQSKLPSLSQSGFMQMIKDPTDNNTGTGSAGAAAAARKPGAKLATQKSGGGGGVPWTRDEFALESGGGAEKSVAGRSWDLDSD